MATEIEAGRPIRSQDLEQQAARQEERFRQAEAAIDETLSRTEMMSLALQASRPPRPSEAVPGHYVQYVDATAGPGGQMIGPFATGKRLRYSQPLKTEDVQGTGELDLLRPGSIWAARSENRVEVFEARLQPARLLQYNELVIPHIAGQISVDLYHDQGKESYIGLESSRVIRSREEHSFNGRIRVESRSAATDPHGNYIHTMGGVSLFNSDWPRRSHVEGRITLPEDGTLTQLDVTLHPSGTKPVFTIEQKGEIVSLPYTGQKGDVLEVHATDIAGELATSLLRAVLTIS